MANNRPVVYRGKSLGIVVLVAAQTIIGVIHIISGIWLLIYEFGAGVPMGLAYDIYTLAFGLLVLVFAVYLWRQSRFGWAGTIAVSFFVIAADALTILDLPSIPGIPKLPAYTEIAYSLVVVLYLLTDGVRSKFLH